jgi:hypothetical protein
MSGTPSFVINTGLPPASTWCIVDEFGAYLVDEDGDFVVWLVVTPSIYVRPGRILGAHG